jgi:hypothetical protein
MIVSAFDLATTTGACDGAPGSVPRSWTWQMKGQTREQRFGMLLAYADQYFAESLPDAVFVEAPLPLAVKRQRQHLDSESAVSVLRGMIAILTASASRAGVRRIQAIDVQDARHAFLGHSPGAGEGKEAVWRMCKALGWAPANLDESDSMAIWAMGCAMVNPRIAHIATPLFARK